MSCNQPIRKAVRKAVDLRGLNAKRRVVYMLDACQPLVQ